MKLVNKKAACLVFMVTALIAASCSTTKMDRSGDVRTTMHTVDNDIRGIVVQLDAIGASLDDLIRPGQADVNKAFELYTENVSVIKRMEADFSKHADQMQARGRDYFAEWEKQDDKYNNPEIQRLSEDRRAELGMTYDDIAKNSIGVEDAFKTYVSDVNEIQVYMSNDLTSSGIASITEISSNAVRHGNHLKNELRSLQSAIDKARVEMAQAGN